jgi:hypothetical protein
MRYVKLLSAAVLVAGFYLLPSCNKVINPRNPLPEKYKIQSYTKISTLSGATINENYSFFYNSDNRVSNILFTSNDSNNFDKSARFEYSNDTIYKTVTRVKTSLVVERDTFIQNSLGQITTAYFPQYYRTFEYFGKLLVRVNETFYNVGYSSNTQFKSTVVYTSNNSDFLRNDGNLSINYPYFSSPISVAYTNFNPKAPILVTADGVGNDLRLNDYIKGGIYITSVDDFGNVDTATYPGLDYKQTFGVFPDQINRMGDYMQLGSFTTYGVNLYQNTHLVKSIYTAVDSSDITYVIDGDSKITQTHIATKDHSGIIRNTAVYKMQYMAN